MCSEVTVNSLVTVTIVTYKVAPDRDGAARRLGRAAVAEAASKKPVTLWCMLLQTGNEVCGR